MRRRRGVESGSLDLLLDTICNTFGGIVFISLLVVILLNMTGEQIVTETVSAKDQARLSRLAQDLEEANRNLKRLQKSLERQEQMASNLGTSEIESLIREVTRLQSELTEVTSETNDTRVETAKTQVETNELELRKRRLQDALKKLAELKKKYAEKVAAKLQEFHPPIERLSNKIEMGFYLKNGRLHSFGKLLPDGTFALNQEEVEEKQDPLGAVVLLPRPGSGLPVVSGRPVSSEIRNRLAEYDPDAHFIHLWVWPDSFDHLASVHEEITRQGLEYRFDPLIEDEHVSLSSSPVPQKVRVQGGP